MQQEVTVSIDVSNNTSHLRDFSMPGIEVRRQGTQRGKVEDQTIEQMSPIQSVHEKTHNSSAHQTNFFREDPEKTISKHLRGLTPKQIAEHSKYLLEVDRAEHRDKNLKMVERQKRKVAAVRRKGNDDKQPK